MTAMRTLFPRTTSDSFGKMQPMTLVVADQIVRSGLRLGIALSIVRMCAKEDFSFYTTLQPIYMYMLYVCTSFILGPYLVFFHDKQTRNIEQYNAGIFLIFSFTLIVLGILYILLYSVIYTPAYHGIYFMLASLYFIFGDLFNLFTRSLCIARMKYGQSLLSGTGSILFIGIGFAFIRNSISLVSILLLAGAGYMIPSLVIWFYGYRNSMVFPSAQNLKENLSRHYLFGKWIFLNTFLNTVVFASFPFFLRILDKNEQIGEYGAYYNFFALFNPVMIILMNYFAPRLSQSYQKGPSVFFTQIRTALKYTLFFSVAFLGFLLFSGKTLFTLFYGHDYTFTGSILLLWGIAKIAEINSCVLNAAIKATQQTSRIFLSSVISAVVFFLIGLPLVKIAGLWGIASGLAITQLFWTGALGFFLISASRKPGVNRSVNELIQ